MAIFKSDITNNLKQEFVNNIIAGLRRKSVTSCSKWAEQYRVMYDKITNTAKNWSFDGYEWLRDMHDSKAETNVGQKSAQMGYTECMLNIVFYRIDISGVDCLYVLPAKTPDAGDFSASRFDSALELSPHLVKLFSDVKNVGHKRAGSANLYIRGSKSRAGLKSVPVGHITLDEVDEMPRKNISLALERTSGQLTKSKWLISTPTLENVGISKFFKVSSQNHFYFRCPCCSRFTELHFLDSLKICGESIYDPKIKDSYLICTLCQNKINHEDKAIFINSGKWIESYSNRDSKGWYINQLYSPTITPSEMAYSYYASLQDFTEEQEFWNSKGGLTHEVAGASISDSELEKAVGGYMKKQSDEHGLVTMGVDVGYPWIHYEIDKWIMPSTLSSNDLNLSAKCKMLSFGKVREMEHLDKLMNDFNIRFCVIDAHPERRKAYEFSTRFHGRVRLAFYGNSINGKQIHLSDQDEPTLTVDRTSWLDMSLGRFRTGTITTPADTDFEYKEHIKALVRVYKKDKLGNSVAEYVNVKADHYGHARNYSEIALPLAASLAYSQTLTHNVL